MRPKRSTVVYVLEGALIATWIKDASDVVIAVLGIGAPIWGLVVWFNRPKFRIGVPPSGAEQAWRDISAETVGRPAMATAFVHSPRCLAARLRRKDRSSFSKSELKRIFDGTSARCRFVVAEGTGHIAVPVIIVNHGGRAALEYWVTITIFNPAESLRKSLVAVKIRDVATETLKFQLYVEEPDNLTGSNSSGIAAAIAPQPIVDAYYDYMGDKVNSWGDSVYLGNSPLEASQYEMVHLTLQADQATDRFVMIFTVDAMDRWVRSAAFIQGFRIVRSSDVEHPPPASLRVPGRTGVASRLRRAFPSAVQVRSEPSLAGPE